MLVVPVYYQRFKNDYLNKRTIVTGIVLVYTKYSIKQVVQLLYTSDTIPKF